MRFQQLVDANKRQRTQSLLASAAVVLELALLLSFSLRIVEASDTNALAAKAGAVLRPPPPGPQSAATEYERAGRKSEAAVLYEEMARTNTVARKVLAHRLVMIYSETGETNKALAWAREVIRENPDPQAYLAAVHVQLGQYKKAREILENAISENTNTARVVTLRWQLAEVHKREGDGAKAIKALAEAAEAAKGTAMEFAAQRRLSALRRVPK